MSLRVWLPLNGTLDSQGLDDVVVTNNGATIDNSGKIGKCYSFDGSSYLSVPTDFSNFSTTECSICVWAKLPEPSSGNKQLIHIGKGSGWTNNRFVIIYRTGYAQIITSMSNGTNYVAYNCSTSIETNTWIHIAAIYKDKTLKLYINGDLKKSYTTTYDISFNSITSFGVGAAPNGAEKLTGYLNDVRIYDHALSPFEVKQISQGLILHYPLNNNGFGQKNLLAGTNQEFISGNEFNKTLDLAPIFDNYGLVPYTISFDLKSADISNRNIIMVYCQNGSGARYSISQKNINNVTTEYKRYSVTVTPVLDKLNLTQSYLAFYGNYNTGNKPRVKNIKVELGLKATPWCPNEADELYNLLELNNNILYDTSGYGNNGAKTGTFTYDSDTPKYNVSTVFNKASYINIGQQLFNARDEITVNLWIKADSWATNPGTFFSSVQSGGYGWQKNNNAYKVYCGTGTSSNRYISVNLNTTTLDASKWHMMTITYNGMVLKTYIDGTLKTTTSKYSTKTPLFFNSSSTMFIGGEADSNQNIPANTSSYPNFEGKISDVRIYCTALSAEDILSLYNNSTYIDNLGNIYGAIYEEV